VYMSLCVCVCICVCMPVYMSLCVCVCVCRIYCWIKLSLSLLYCRAIFNIILEPFYAEWILMTSTLIYMYRILVMPEGRSYQKTWRSTSVQWPWWSLIVRSLSVLNWPASALLKTLFFLENSLFSTSCVRNSSLNRYKMAFINKIVLLFKRYRLNTFNLYATTSIDRQKEITKWCSHFMNFSLSSLGDTNCHMSRCG